MHARKVRRIKRDRGFTLIELLVVTAIMVLISGLILANNSRFGGTVLLQNLAYDIALSIRQAQVYGISVQRFDGSFGAAYGMHFQKNAAGTSAVYALFGDTDDNGLYTDGGELARSTTIAKGYSIAQLCATRPGLAERCDLTDLDITFKRPEPDAYIRTSAFTGVNESGKIIVSSPRGDLKTILVEANGQISVQ